MPIPLFTRSVVGTLITHSWLPSTPSSPAPRDPVPNSVGSPTLDNLSFGMLTCASRLNTQPQWTHSSAFVRQRQGEFRIAGVARDLYPKAFILPPATLP